MNTGELEEDKIIQINMPFKLSKIGSLDTKKIHNVYKALTQQIFMFIKRIYWKIAKKSK